MRIRSASLPRVTNGGTYSSPATRVNALLPRLPEGVAPSAALNRKRHPARGASFYNPRSPASPSRPSAPSTYRSQDPAGHHAPAFNLPLLTRRCSGCAFEPVAAGRCCRCFAQPIATIRPSDHAHGYVQHPHHAALHTNAPTLPASTGLDRRDSCPAAATNTLEPGVILCRGPSPPKGGGPEARFQSTEYGGASPSVPTSRPSASLRSSVLPGNLAKAPWTGRHEPCGPKHPHVVAPGLPKEAGPQSRVPNLVEPVGLPLRHLHGSILLLPKRAPVTDFINH